MNKFFKKIIIVPTLAVTLAGGVSGVVQQPVVSAATADSIYSLSFNDRHKFEENTNGPSTAVNSNGEVVEMKYAKDGSSKLFFNIGKYDEKNNEVKWKNADSNNYLKAGQPERLKVNDQNVTGKRPEVVAP